MKYCTLCWVRLFASYQMSQIGQKEIAQLCSKHDKLPQVTIV